MSSRFPTEKSELQQLFTGKQEYLEIDKKLFMILGDSIRDFPKELETNQRYIFLGGQKNSNLKTSINELHNFSIEISKIGEKKQYLTRIKEDLLRTHALNASFGIGQKIQKLLNQSDNSIEVEAAIALVKKLIQEDLYRFRMHGGERTKHRFSERLPQNIKSLSELERDSSDSVDEIIELQERIRELVADRDGDIEGDSIHFEYKAALERAQNNGTALSDRYKDQHEFWSRRWATSLAVANGALAGLLANALLQLKIDPDFGRWPFWISLLGLAAAGFIPLREAMAQRQEISRIEEWLESLGRIEENGVPAGNDLQKPPDFGTKRFLALRGIALVCFVLALALVALLGPSHLSNQIYKLSETSAATG